MPKIIVYRTTRLLYCINNLMTTSTRSVYVWCLSTREQDGSVKMDATFVIVCIPCSDRQQDVLSFFTRTGRLSYPYAIEERLLFLKVNKFFVKNHNLFTMICCKYLTLNSFIYIKITYVIIFVVHRFSRQLSKIKHVISNSFIDYRTHGFLRIHYNQLYVVYICKLLCCVYLLTQSLFVDRKQQTI